MTSDSSRNPGERQPRTTASPEPSRRSPRQERSKSTVEAIVEAAARVLAESSLDGVTTTRIARVAGVSIGSLYQYFPGKEAIASAMIRRQADEDVARIRRAVEESRGLALDARLERVLDVGFEAVLARPRLFVFILTYLPALDLLPVARDLERRLADEIARVFDEHRDELEGVDPWLASLGGIGAVRGALLAIVHHAPERLDDAEGVKRYLVDVVLGYVDRVRSRSARAART